MCISLNSIYKKVGAILHHPVPVMANKSLFIETTKQCCCCERSNHVMGGAQIFSNSCAVADAKRVVPKHLHLLFVDNFICTPFIVWA